METLQAKIADLRLRLTAACAADPRKAWLLTILTTALLVLIGRMTFKSGAVPTAQGHTAARAAAARGPWPVYSANGATMAASLAQWGGQPIEAIPRNLFCIPLDYYAYADGSHPRDSAEAAGTSDAQNELRREHENLVNNLRTQAADLKLQGIVLGETPQAWINGALIAPGQLIGSSGFRLMRIEARRIIVEQDGVLIGIDMN